MTAEQERWAHQLSASELQTGTRRMLTHLQKCTEGAPVSKVDIEEGRRLLAAMVQGAESLCRGMAPVNRAAVVWAVNNVGALMDEVERLRAMRYVQECTETELRAAVGDLETELKAARQEAQTWRSTVDEKTREVTQHIAYKLKLEAEVEQLRADLGETEHGRQLAVQMHLLADERAEKAETELERLTERYL